MNQITSLFIGISIVGVMIVYLKTAVDIFRRVP
jgi:hypothetical protein